MSPFQVWFDGWWIHHTGTRVRQLVSFTVRTGLAEQFHTYLLKFSAFPTCYFSFCVSTPGRLGVLEALLSPSPALRRNFIYPDTAHNPIQAIIVCPFARMRISLKVMDTDLPLLDDRMMDLLAVLSCSLLPICYRTFIQSLGMNNRLDRASIREQDHHDHDQCRWPAQPFHHRASSCTKCLLTRVTTRALGLIRMNTNVALSDFASCGTRLIRATLF